MKNKLPSILLILGMSFPSFGQYSAPSDNKDRHELMIGLGFNAKNKFLTPNFGYTSLNLFKAEKINWSINFEGFKPIAFVLSEVNRLNFNTGYKFGNSKFSTRPRIGFSIYFDRTDINDVGSGLYFVPTIGNLTKYQLKKFIFEVDQFLSIYSDGIWLELFPAIGYKITPFLLPKIGVNNIIAITYKGNSGFGFYPYFKLVWLVK